MKGSTKDIQEKYKNKPHEKGKYINMKHIKREKYG
jgi:hypothetical protein